MVNLVNALRAACHFNNRRLVAGGIILLSMVLFGVGLWLHFGTLLIASEPVIYGDAGDGLFNLWILEHVIHSIGVKPASLADGRIFWPAEPYTYWWSDNLLAPAALYGFLKFLVSDMYLAYRATVLLLSFALYAAFVWLFVELRRGVRRSSSLPDWTVLLAPPAAYLAFFSQIHLHDYLHFQHLAALFLVILIIGALRHVADWRRRDWILMLVSQCLLLYSAPYYAVLGLCILLCRVFFLFADRRINLWSWGWRHALLALPVVLLCVPAALMYGKAEPIHYSLGQIRALSLQVEHFFVPMDGWLREVLESGLPDRLPALRGGGYPGTGLLIGSALAVVLSLAIWRRRLYQSCRPRHIKLFLVLCALTFIGDRDFTVYAWSLRLILVPVGLFLLAWHWRRGEHRPVSRQMALLVAMLVTVYGTAFGPGLYFKPPYTDISVWSFYSWLVPGYLNMREVLRFSSLGQLLLLALLWVLLLRAWSATQGRLTLRWTLGMVVMVLVGLQLSETVGARVRQTRIVPGHIALQDDESSFFGDLKGAMLAIPTLPFHHNTFHQLRWVGFPNLYLLNGYSARSTAIFDRLMMLEHTNGRASDEQLAYAAEVGARYVCVLCGRVPAATLKSLQEQYQTLFVNDRFLVLALATSDNSGDVTDSILESE